MSLPTQTVSEGTTPAAANSPYLHPLQSHKVRETHKANVDTDFTTGRKLINHYEVIEELGRGMHGKVKLARDLETGDNVAIKIVPRFSKRRRLGKVTAMSTQDKSKREIAILKKIRHPNVVALLEIIDDPELKKIYMVLEHVELGEIVWRKKGLPHICVYERRRVERDMRGEEPTPEEDMYERVLERRQAIKDMKRAKMSQSQRGTGDYWSLEYAASEDDDTESQSRSLPRNGSDLISSSFRSNPGSLSASRATSRAPSRNQSSKSLSRSGTPQPSESEYLPSSISEDDLETPVPIPTGQTSAAMLDGTMYGAYVEDSSLRGRSPSMADSIISHMSSVDFNRVHDPFADDFSYVPCFTQEQARSTFRDTVLGLEYLHYEGVVHRDIKPANLLWTREHRVKISDFGVSYFGRPIRDGELDESISESEAKDFDDDLELAKTVGTPAFFAPELCYTEPFDAAGRPHVQPKVSEQIDVWSLGVTLYCLIFARIPFLAEDEWQMFRKIASEDVFIPSRRLRPVDPATKPNERSLYHRVNPFPYRDDDELAYEDVESELIDLLTKMLMKNPAERIRLRDVKRHPWVTQGIPNPLAWIDDTDPSRFTAGRRIQVDDREMAHAVVPISILERAKSAMKRAVGKVIPHRTDRLETTSRRRAASSAASSGVDITAAAPGNATPHPRDARRKSLRADDYFANVYSQSAQTSGNSSDHPLSQSVTASPDHTPDEELPGSANGEWTASVGAHSTTRPANMGDFNAVEEADRQADTSTQRTIARHSHARSVTNAFLSLTAAPQESSTAPPTPMLADSADDPSNALRKARDLRSASEDSTRSRSVDRGLFSSADKRAEAKVSLSTAVAPGNVSLSQRPALTPDLIRGLEGTSLPSPCGTAFPRGLTGYQHSQPVSDPNMQDRRQPLADLEVRPKTAHRIQDLPGARTPPPRVYNSSTPESFARAQEQMLRRQAREHEEQWKRQQVMQAVAATMDDSNEPARVACPPSPDDEIFMPKPVPLSREGTIATAVSSSSSVAGTTTPLTSPSVTTDPASTTNLVPASVEASEQILAYQSDPSLPALLSGASSVSADPEGDFLSSPGVVNKPSVIDTTDSLTPPAVSKEPLAGFPLDQQEEQAEDGLVTIGFDDRGIGRAPLAMQSSSGNSHKFDDEADETDSDEGITMARSKKKGSARDSLGRAAGNARRRDTNASIGSTDTAKKLVVEEA